MFFFVFFIVFFVVFFAVSFAVVDLSKLRIGTGSNQRRRRRLPTAPASARSAAEAGPGTIEKLALKLLKALPAPVALEDAKASRR
jgi:hypothetical protein